MERFIGEHRLKEVMPPLFRKAWRLCTIIGLGYVLFAKSCPAKTLNGSRVLNDFIVGINIHSFNKADMPLLEELGISATRSDRFWAKIADSRGDIPANSRCFDSILDARYVKVPLVVLAYGHPAFDHGGRIVSDEGRAAYIKYALTVVDRLMSRMPLYEVWNEWNWDGEERGGSGRPEDYVRLLKDTYSRVKTAYPDVKVLGGAMTGIGQEHDYLEHLIDGGALNFMDGLSIHPYYYEDRNVLPEIALRDRLGKVLKLLSESLKGSNMPIYVTELGWPTYSGPGGEAPEEQSKQLIRSILILAMEARVKGVWLYELRDAIGGHPDRENHFGIVLNNGTPKPAFYALRDVIRVLNRANTIEDIHNDSNGAVMTVRLHNKDGSETWICWAIRPDERWNIELKRTEAGAVRTIGQSEATGLRRNPIEMETSIEVSDLPSGIRMNSPGWNVGHIRQTSLKRS
jgi:hypothetical protein